MDNITFDSSSFYEQLGIYDFFNVLLSGTIFVFGLCAISSNLNSYLWSNITVQKGIAIVLLIYIIGIILQELGSIADRKIFKIYKGMNRSILKGKLDNQFTQKTNNKIIGNPMLLKRYRESADKIIEEFNLIGDEQRFENENVSGLYFSICQYYVSIQGKDKKVEKLRALFAMSKTLIVCFFLLAILALLSVVFSTDKISVDIFSIIGITNLGCEVCSGKVMWAFIFLGMGFIFYIRAKRTMKNFLLILLGTYDALIRTEQRIETNRENT